VHLDQWGVAKSAVYRDRPSTLNEMFHTYFVEIIKTHNVCYIYIYIRISYRFLDNAEKCCTSRQATDDNIIWRMRIACWILEATKTITKYKGRFIIFSLITNIDNKKTKRPTLMELFTDTGKMKTFFKTREVRCLHHG
jgi:predicted DNA-binding protein YlxM (UPF0122 family)